MASQFISLSMHNSIIDTGTTLTYFSYDNYNSIINLIREYCSTDNHCIGKGDNLPCFNVPTNNIT